MPIKRKGTNKIINILNRNINKANRQIALTHLKKAISYYNLVGSDAEQNKQLLENYINRLA